MQGLCSFAPQQTGEPSSFRPCDGKSLPELVKATGKKIRKVRETLLNERAIYVFIGTASKDCRGGWISRSTKGTVKGFMCTSPIAEICDVSSGESSV